MRPLTDEAARHARLPSDGVNRHAREVAVVVLENVGPQALQEACRPDRALLIRGIDFLLGT